ncbi:MAG: DUF484 family protein [Syntrophales bacterium]
MNNSGETKRVNEAIQETFSRIEDTLSAAADIGGLIAYVLQELQEAFNIPFAWFSLVDHPETADWKDKLLKSPFLRGRLNRIDATAFSELAAKGTAPVLANGDLKPFYRLLPQSNKYFIKSIAMAPITMNGVFIGSLNFGDTAPSRYHAEMDTSLLAHLATAVSKNLTERRPESENT